MTKRELVSVIANQLDVTKVLTVDFVNAFIEVVEDELAKGHEVRLVGFGTFKPVQRKARKAINPKTLEPIDIPSRRVPKFVPGKDFKEKVDK